MIQGIASGKEFDEIHVDISNELVQIASTALTEIKSRFRYPMAWKSWSLLLFYPIQHLPSRRSILMQREFMMVSSNRLGGLVNLYRILTSQFMILFIVTSVYRYGHCLHSHNSPAPLWDSAIPQLLYYLVFSITFSKCRRKYARCKAQQPLFRQNSIPWPVYGICNAYCCHTGSSLSLPLPDYQNKKEKRKSWLSSEIIQVFKRIHWKYITFATTSNRISIIFISPHLASVCLVNIVVCLFNIVKYFLFIL